MNDILIDLTTGEFLQKDGDFVVGDATKQNQHLLIELNKNEVKRYPTSCVGGIQYVNDEGPDELMREIRKEYTQDGMKVKDLANNNGKVNVDASYE